MKCNRGCGPESVKAGAQQLINIALRNTTFALLLMFVFLCAAQQAAADPEAAEYLKKNKSRFEYHDGKADEQRPYRRPNPDIDPTNLQVEELRERINALEERLEHLEYQVSGSKKVR